MKSIEIKSASGKYQVNFCDKISEIIIQEESKLVFIVDKEVLKLHGAGLGNLIKDHPVIELEASESKKNLDSCIQIFNFLQEHNIDKSHKLVAIGGGIIQDLVSLSAHLYFRGLKWILIPSTLLSMADSCIGAKAGVNFNNYKNQLGAFHAPCQITLCKEFLDSLDELEIKSGFGEILKLHLIKSPEAFQNFKTTIEKSKFQLDQVLDLIHLSLDTKKKYIEEDEFDTGNRRILNYGHSFGHALEATHSTYIPHGLAITWGMDLINFIAYKKDKLSYEKFLEIHKLIEEYFLKSLNISSSSDLLIEALRKDKKCIDNRINLVYLNENGDFSIEITEINDELANLVEEFINFN